jgi:signal transduction histidine kinase
VKLSRNLLLLSRPLTYLTILALYMSNPDVTLPGRALYGVSAAFFLASCVVLVEWIAVPPRVLRGILWIEIGLVTLLSAYTALAYKDGAIKVLYMPLAVTMPLHFDRREWRAAFGAVIGSWVLTTIPDALVAGTFSALPFILYGAVLLFFSGAGLLIRNLQDEQARSRQLLREVEESRALLERANRQLQESAARQQQVAVLEERQRLAREIHDSVAHWLTALVVQLQAARRLIDRDLAQATTTVGRCEEMAREALQETRRAVRALHPAGLEQQTDVEALRRLARDYAIATGMQVEVTAGSSALALPPDPARLEQLYRIFQEALTNAQRHGQARSTSAELTYEDGVLRLTITNDGVPPSSLGPGVGLRSMAERARSIGGAIAFEPGSPGMTIRVSVPVKQEVAG